MNLEPQLRKMLSLKMCWPVSYLCDGLVALTLHVLTSSLFDALYSYIECLWGFRLILMGTFLQCPLTRAS